MFIKGFAPWKVNFYQGANWWPPANDDSHLLVHRGDSFNRKKSQSVTVFCFVFLFKIIPFKRHFNQSLDYLFNMQLQKPFLKIQKKID